MKSVNPHERGVLWFGYGFALLWFGYQAKANQNQSIPNQTKPKQTKTKAYPNQSKPKPKHTKIYIILWGPKQTKTKPLSNQSKRKPNHYQTKANKKNKFWEILPEISFSQCSLRVSEKYVHGEAFGVVVAPHPS